MVRVDAHFLVVPAERKLADVQWLELVVALEVRPTPHAAVDDVRKAFSVRHLESAVEASRDGNTICRRVGLREGFLELLQGTLLLLELLHERIDGFLGPLLVLVALFPAQKSFDGRRRKRYHSRHFVDNTFGSFAASGNKRGGFSKKIVV